MKLGIDVDEVLARLHAPWIVWGNFHFGTNLDPGQGFTHWDHPQELWGESAFNFLHIRPYARGVVRAYPDAALTMKVLRRRGYEVHYVTSVPGNDPCREVALEKFNWLEDHGFSPYVGRYHVMEHKGDAPVDFLVDDRASNCDAFGWHRSALVARHHNLSDCKLPRLILADVSNLLNIFPALP